jgi:hypothetical protein
MLNERPSEEVLKDDEKFDGWYEMYERDLRQKSFKTTNKH